MGGGAGAGAGTGTSNPWAKREGPFPGSSLAGYKWQAKRLGTPTPHPSTWRPVVPWSLSNVHVDSSDRSYPTVHRQISGRPAGGKGRLQEVNFSGSGPNFSRGRSRCLRVWSRQGLSGAFGFGALKKGAVQFYSPNEQSDKQQVTSNRP